MIATVKDMKGAFISCCAKINGMPVGRTNFQDFEIAYLLNIAYDKCVKSRVDALTQGYHQAGDNEAHPRRDHALGNILSELGDLYAPTVIDEEVESLGSVDIDRFKLWGNESRMFEVPKINGYFPYVIGADLHEVNRKAEDFYKGEPQLWNNIKALGEKRMQQEEANLQSYNRSWPIRIINASEQIEYSLLLRSGNSNYRLPYRIGRIRTYAYRSAARAVDVALDKIRDAVTAVFSGADPDSDSFSDLRGLWSWEQITVIELQHTETIQGGELYCSIERIMHPQPIFENEIKEESERRVEVSFGYEVAFTAAQIAMEVLASGQKIPQQQASGAPSPAA